MTFLIAFCLALLGLIGTRLHLDYVSPNAFWFVLGAYVLLALANVIDGL